MRILTPQKICGQLWRYLGKLKLSLSQDELQIWKFTFYVCPNVQCCSQCLRLSPLLPGLRTFSRTEITFVDLNIWNFKDFFTLFDWLDLLLCFPNPLGWGQFSPTSHTRRIETHCKPRTKTIPQIKQFLVVIWTISRIKAEAVNMEFFQEPVCDVINPPPTQFGDQHLTKSSSSCSSWPAEAGVRLVSYPTRWYLLFVFGFLWWTSS